MANHGICWIAWQSPGRLGIMARPRAGDWLEDEIRGWRQAGVDLVVSLLELEEISDLGLQNEAGLCHGNGIDFVALPIPDRGVPASHGDARSIARDIVVRCAAGQSVAVHCRAGIGRSSVIAGCALVLAGMTAEDALAALSAARGLRVPDTDGQRDWLIGFAQSLRSS